MKIASGRELLHTSAGSTRVLDPTDLDLAAARRATYVLDQAVSYAYPAPAHNLHQQLIVVPPARHHDQERSADQFRVVASTPSESRRRTDRFGNTVLHVRAARVDDHISFDMRAVLERGAVVEPGRWSSRFGGATVRTTADEALQDASADLARQVRRVDLIDAIGNHVHTSMRYVKGVTDVTTTAAQAWQGRAGVCQDMAHVMVVLCRLNGLAARYVSGHLVGEGASHAWVEVQADQGARHQVVAFDPTHDRRTDLRYLTVAVGRDYADVAPTSGTCESARRGELTITKTLSIATLE